MENETQKPTTEEILFEINEMIKNCSATIIIVFGGGERHSELSTQVNCAFSSLGKVCYYLEPYNRNKVTRCAFSKRHQFFSLRHL
jgi:hypothetical protein